MVKKVLIIDDDTDLCLLLSRFLTKNGYETSTASSGSKGLALYDKQKFDAVICDYRLGDTDAKKVIAALKAKDPDAAILIITGYSDIRTAVDVIKLGAFDYIIKPLIPDEVLTILSRMSHVITDNENSTSHQSANTHGDNRKDGLNPDVYVGDSPATVFLYKQARIVAETNYSVVLYGESGTGKEVIARVIHELSPRSNKPFVALDCGTLSKELAGSEMFGHVKGAFTGALNDKEGTFEVANGGTLFLDEVGNLSLEVQATLLRVIQERKFKRVGGNKEIPADVRIIVASNENLGDAYRKGKFREDLYHRFNEFSIHLPPLRERKEDIQPLANFFLKQSSKETGKNIEGFDSSVLDIFMDYPWPGNLREFRNVVRRAVLLSSEGNPVSIQSLPKEIADYHRSIGLNGTDFGMKKDKTGLNQAALNDPLKGAAIRAEYDTIMNVLQQVNFNKKKAAEMLKIDRKTLYNKLKTFQSMDQS
jgi:two-component system response regulator HydG